MKILKTQLILALLSIIGAILMIAGWIDADRLSKSGQYNLVVWAGFGILTSAVVVLAMLGWIKEQQ